MGFVVTTVMACDYLQELQVHWLAYGAHTGIGTLPVVLYGTGSAKQNTFRIWQLENPFWFTALLSQMLVQMLIQEKTKAKLSEDGKHYIINGQKMGFQRRICRDFHIILKK